MLRMRVARRNVTAVAWTARAGRARMRPPSPVPPDETRRMPTRRSIVPGALALVAAATAGCSTAGPDAAPWPRTAAEVSGHRATTTHAEAMAFLEAVAARSPRIRLASAGRSVEGRDLALALAADPPVTDLAAAARDPRPKVLVVANIHAGEVEAKEAVLEIVREIGQGRHGDLLDGLIVVFLPVYNADGNDAVNRRARPEQAGPAEGVGRRANAQGLDLNRDFTKAEAPETRALLGLFTALDPVLVIDGHTTDGSYHGFDLTYAGPLSPASDPAILDYSRNVFLPAFREAMARHGFATWDYGNWEGEWRPPRNLRRWETYDHLPRYGVNYFGLCNRLALLSEAYAHAPFARRIAATRALVLEALRLVRRDLDRIVRLEREADARTRALAPGGALPLDARLASDGPVALPASSVRKARDAATRSTWLEDTGVHTWIETEAHVRFEGLAPATLPAAWAVDDPPPELARLLDVHGIAWSVLDRPAVVAGEIDVVSAVRSSPAPFQGHTLRELVTSRRSVPVPLRPGAILVPAAQRRARIAFLLLEAGSPDGLAAWELLPPRKGPDGAFRHRVFRLREPPPAPGTETATP